MKSACASYVEVKVQLTSSETVTTIETDSVTTRRAVDLDLSGIRREALRGVFRGDSALECKAAGRDMVLRETELLERGSSRDLDLRSDDVDARDFLGNGVLDLDARIDLT